MGNETQAVSQKEDKEQTLYNKEEYMTHEQFLSHYVRTIISYPKRERLFLSTYGDTIIFDAMDKEKRPELAGRAEQDNRHTMPAQ